MENTTLVLIIFVPCFLFFLFSGWPIAFGVSAVTILGLFLVGGGRVGNFAYLGYNALCNYHLLALPVFILMGEVLIAGGVGQRLYDGVGPLMNRIRGGLIYSNIVMNTVLGAACGSTIAATSAISAVAIPELEKRHYKKGLVYGSLASSGCLAALIPPSVGMIIYAALTDTSLGELFVAGIVPGLLFAASLIVTTKVSLMIRPDIAPEVTRQDLSVPIVRAFFSSVTGLWPLLLLIVMVLGSIYSGFATPTEAAAYGVIGAFILGIRRISRKTLKTSLNSTLQISVSLFFIIGMASVYGFTLNSLGIRGLMIDFLVALPFGVYTKVYMVWLALLLLGMFLDCGSVMILTIPILTPFMVSLGFSPTWFGIYIILAIELGNITPPVGLTLYAVQAVSGDKLETIAKGALPYWAAYFMAVTPIIFFPEIALWLPRLAGMGG